MDEGRRLPSDPLVEIVPATRKPLRGLSRFALPPTLLGFFFCGRGDDVEYADAGNYDGEETEEDEALLPYLLPQKKYGCFAKLSSSSSAAPFVDLGPSSFLTKALPEVDLIYLLDSCNGLLLFGHVEDAHSTLETCYIVCNPATEQWVAIPGCGRIDPTRRRSPSCMHTHLLFFPANPAMTTAQAYSSETRAWSSEGAWSLQERLGPLERWRFSSTRNRDLIPGESLGAKVNGMLYLISGRDRILQVDAKGKTRRIIWAPGERHQQGGYFTNSVLFVGQSQGRLYCIIEDGHDDMAQLPLFDAMQFWDLNCGVSVWVLQDSDAQEWVLKGRVSYMQLFGKMTSDGNVQYRHRDCKMVSYDIDYRQEVQALDTDLQDDCQITPYVPYLSELFLGVIGAHKLAH
ncbi:hypothetical protein PVAP13_2NG075000 [Panicum virgatum]|uniref:Uncharacterized protein n=1 Tax=Panicum virgatum TaxID=38727 RepID=A0A8T0VCU4_PANVG|nr:hypothetical protein PVAP13_2NG075000 [Panicum virgatum]